MCYSLRLDAGVLAENNVVSESNHKQTLQASAPTPLILSKNSLKTKGSSSKKVGTDSSTCRGTLRNETVGQKSFAVQDKVILF